MATNFEKIMEAFFLDEIQDEEDKLWDFYDRLDVDSCEGDQLDNLGTIIGQDRIGLSDVDYKSYIKAKIAQNVSQGGAKAIYGIFYYLAGFNCEIVEIFPASILIYILQDLPTGMENYIKNFIDDSLLAGVKLDEIIRENGSDSFAFDGPGDYKGFSSLAVPTSGGKLSALI